MTSRRQPRPLTLNQARRMFRGVLASWASDLLELRRRGLDVPGSRGSGYWSVPGAPFAARPRREVRGGMRRAA